MTMPNLQTSKGVENPIAAVHEDNPGLKEMAMMKLQK